MKIKAHIAPIQTTNDADIADIIKSVGIEFGAVGEGFGPADEEVLHMSQYYSLAHNSVYLVASIDHVIVGGCGVAAWSQSNSVCELRKLFLLPSARGHGLGKRLVMQCLDFAKQHGYEQCYLDTLKSMNAAIELYKTLGFKHLDQPLAETIHSGCDVWMLKKLR